MTKYNSLFRKNKNIEKEEKKDLKEPNVKRGLVVLATVGVGMGVYGWVNGRLSGYKDGYRRGVTDGMAYTVAKFTETMKAVAEKPEVFKED